MTTFTITCPPTVGTFGSSRTGNSTISETASVGTEQQASGFSTSSIAQSFQTLSNSDVLFTLQRTLDGGGAFSLGEQLEDLGTNSVVGTTQVTRSWNGAATTSESEFNTTTFGSADIITETDGTDTYTNFGPSYLTSSTGEAIFTTSASSFSTTASQATSTTRTTQQNSTFTTTRTTNSTTGTLLSSSVPRTTATQTSIVFSSASSFSTTRFTTTRTTCYTIST